MKNEKLTRQEIINLRLKEAGWDVNDRTQVTEELHVDLSVVSDPQIPYNKRNEYSDYALLGSNGKPLAVVEAKRTSVDAQIGREQSKQYCYHIKETLSTELPFCFYTNGNDLYFWDLENYPPKKIQGFPTLQDLERFLYLRRSRKSLASELINTRIAGRDYQIAAIRSIMEAIEKRKQKFLLVMATGTGKTRTCIALVDALMRAGWIERTLFLVDRIALRDQALEAFKDHLPNEPRWPKEGETTIATNRRIYVSTYPTMLNIIQSNNNILSPHFFDLIVIDESHRSIYNTYQNILSYFNTLTLGLTATPTDVIDHNTFQLFEEEDGIPSFAFSYDEAVNHIPPYLCNFQVMKIITKFQEQGINKRTISLEDQKKLIQEGKEIEEINYEGSELERTVTNRGTNALIVREFMEECIKDENGILPGKTIFFCATKAHARRIEEIFDSLYPEFKGGLAKVMVSEDPRVYGKGGLLHQFKQEDMPRVAISVDMLDTGVDIREVVNLVFAKPVYSYTKFWQMIGRGTRLLEEDKIKSWCTKKDEFLILDCWDNFEYFKLNPRGKELTPQIPLPIRLAGLLIDKMEKALGLGKYEIATKEIGKIKLLIDRLPAQSIVIRDATEKLEKLNNDTFWSPLDTKKIQFIRDEIKPLFRALSGIDYKAMRFEKDILEISLAHLYNDKNKFDALQDSIIERISELPLSVNTVSAYEELIRESQTYHYWTTIDESKLDELIDKIAPLMKFHETTYFPRMVKYNFKDVVSQKEYIEFSPDQGSVSISKYRELVEERIHTLVSANPILQKLQQGSTLNSSEAEILAIELSNEYPHITEELLQKAYNNRKAKLEQFIKHILGIEVLESFPESVTKSFDKFIKEHTDLNSRQLDFLHLLRTFLIEKGTVEKKDLITAPFTKIHPNGILGIFNKREIDEIIQFIENLAA